MCMSSMKDQSTNYKSNWHMKAYSKWYYAKPGVVSFEQMVKLSMNLDFPNGNFWSSILTRIVKFPSAYRNSFQGCIFLKEINHWLLVLFLPTFIFCKKMCFQNDETGVLEDLEINFFSLPNHGGQTFTNFFNNFFHALYNSVVAYL